MRMRFESCGLLLSGLLLFSAGCSKRDTPTSAASPPPDKNTIANTAPVPNAAPANTAPGPAPTPTAPVVVTSTNNTDAVLAQLTRQLHRMMIGRKLSGNFDEFVAISHVQVPPPPAGKKYAIDKHWHVVLVNN